MYAQACGKVGLMSSNSPHRSRRANNRYFPPPVVNLSRGNVLRVARSTSKYRRVYLYVTNHGHPQTEMGFNSLLRSTGLTTVALHDRHIKPFKEPNGTKQSKRTRSSDSDWRKCDVFLLSHKLLDVLEIPVLICHKDPRGMQITYPLCDVEGIHPCST